MRPGANAGNPRGESGHQRRERLPTWVAAISGLGAGYRKWLLQCGTGSSAGADTNGEFDGNRDGLQIVRLASFLYLGFKLLTPVPMFLHRPVGPALTASVTDDANGWDDQW